MTKPIPSPAADDRTHDIFLTGATGLVGSHLLHAFLAQGLRVKALVRDKARLAPLPALFDALGQGGRGLLEAVDWLEGDLLDYPLLLAQTRGCARVVHAAALVSFDPADAERARQANVLGTSWLVDACLVNGLEGMMHISSVATVRSPDDGSPADEREFSTWQTASGHYARSKLKAEMAVWRGREEGLPVVVLNPSVVLGASADQRSSARLVGLVWEGLRHYPLGGTGFVDARDLARAAALLLARPEAWGERYILSAADLSYRDFFAQVALLLMRRPPDRPLAPAAALWLARAETALGKILGRPPRLTPDAVRSSAKISRYSSEKFRRATGFEFMPIEKSIRDLCAQFLNERTIS